MIIKNRTKSITHRMFESLNSRMHLNLSETSLYQNQIKGFEGEQAFDRIMSSIPHSNLVINDLLLSTRDTFYQIDSLLITPGHIYLYEIKNYTGHYNYEEGVIYSKSGHAIQDPVAQAERKRSYLHNLLLNLELEVRVSAFVVFIQPDFYIYNFPEQKSVIFEGQLSSHLKTLLENTKTGSVFSKKVAEKLSSLHNDSYRLANLPNDYSFDQLKKGIVCPKCFSFAYTATRQTRTCTACCFQEKISAAIYRSIEEFRLLFPDQRLNKTIISAWCGNDFSKSRIQSVLKTKYYRKSRSRGTYYV